MPHDVLPMRQHIDQGPGLGPYQYAVIGPAAANICNLMTLSVPIYPDEEVCDEYDRRA